MTGAGAAGKRSNGAGARDAGQGPTLPGHLNVRRHAGLIDETRAGKQRFYRARKEILGPLADYLEAMWGARLMELKTLAEAEENSDA